MKTILIALAAVAVAGVMLSAGLAIANGDDDEMAVAGGGGWFLAKDAKGAIFKDTFGFSLNATDLENCSFVLQARDAGAKVQAYQFDKVTISDADADGNWSAEAWGKAWGAGKDWNFYLKVTDFGPRKMDMLMLTVTLVDDPAVTLSWETTGLGGGQIWVNGE